MGFVLTRFTKLFEQRENITNVMNSFEKFIPDSYIWSKGEKVKKSPFLVRRPFNANFRLHAGLRQEERRFQKRCKLSRSLVFTFLTHSRLKKTTLFKTTPTALLNWALWLKLTRCILTIIFVKNIYKEKRNFERKMFAPEKPSLDFN